MYCYQRDNQDINKTGDCNMNRKAFKVGLESLGFTISPCTITDMVYGQIKLYPVPYRDETDTKIIPSTIVVCDMGGVDKGENLGCVSCSVSATVKRPYARKWETGGEVHKFAFVDDGKIDVIKEVKEWMEEYQACVKGWEIVK